MTFRIEFFLDGENLEMGYTGDYDNYEHAYSQVMMLVTSHAHSTGTILQVTIVEVK